MPFNYTTNLVVPLSSSVSARDELPVIAQTAAVELNQSFNGMRALAENLDRLTGNSYVEPSARAGVPLRASIVGGSAYQAYLQCGPTVIPFGAMVAIDQGTGRIILAQANSATHLACGYSLNTTPVQPNEWAPFNFGPGLNYGLAGLLMGRWYYLSPSAAGLLTPNQPGPGSFVQIVGMALSTSALMVGSLTDWYL